MRYILPSLLLCSALYGVDLGTIEVGAKADTYEQKESFADVFEEVEYFENAEHVNSMPAQKRLTTDEAMFIPGVQGDPIKAVQALSGVTSVSDMSGELFIYGSKPEESLTTINHLPIGYLFHMGGLHSVIAPDAIDQIDAYMAGFDVTYGNAMGGVINVTPKYPLGEYKGYAHLGIYDASAGISAPVNDDISIYFGARRSYFDLALDAIGKSTGTLDEDTNTTYTEFPNYYDFTFIGTYQIDGSNLLSLELIGAEDSLDIYTEANKVKDPKANGQIKAKFGFTTFGLRHQGFYNNYETNTLVYNKQENFRTKLFDEYYVDFAFEEYGLFHQSAYDIGKHRLIAGLEIQKYYLPIDFSIPNTKYQELVSEAETVTDSVDVDEMIYSAFLQDIYNINDELTLRYGLRTSTNTYNHMGTYIDPRASIIYRLDEKSNVSLSSGIYTQMPEGRKTAEGIGNPDADYERSNHYLIHYDSAHLDSVNFSIDGFYKEYKDLLIDDNVSNYLSRGDGYAYGIDTSIKYKSDKYFAFLAYTYLRSKREVETGNEELYRFYGEVPHTLQLIGGMRLWGNFALSTRLNYHSGKPYTKIIGTETINIDGENILKPIYGEEFASRLPDYFSLNVKIAQEIKLEKNESFEWSFEIMNITNHENITGIEYDDNYNKEGYSKSLPLLPWLDITYRF
jgi:outer membrane receptor for ferrienterochelin and colicin